MDRISGSGATADNRFKETPAPATRVSSSWLNGIQEELARVIEDPQGGARALDGGDNGQLLASILAMAARAVSGVNDQAGDLQAQISWLVQSGQGGARAYNRDDATQLLASVLAMIGRVVSWDVAAQSFSLGPVVFKIGHYGPTFNEQGYSIGFATPFANACWIVLPVVRNDNNSNIVDVWAQIANPTVNGFTAYMQTEDSDTNERRTTGFDWIAIGW